MQEHTSLSLLKDGDSFEEVVFRGLLHNKTTLTDISFQQCNFIGVSITESTVKKGYFDTCHFEKCHFNLTKFIETTITQCIFHECTLVGTDFTKMITTLGCYITVDHCNAELSLWSKLNLSKSSFIHSRLVEAVFTEATITDASFMYSDLAKAVFDRADLRRSDFRGAKNYFINPFDSKIRKAKFSEPEVVKLLIPLEIIIEDPPIEDTDS